MKEVRRVEKLQGSLNRSTARNVGTQPIKEEGYMLFQRNSYFIVINKVVGKKVDVGFLI